MGLHTKETPAQYNLRMAHGQLQQVLHGIAVVERDLGLEEHKDLMDRIKSVQSELISLSKDVTFRRGQ